jgi:tight adherence protein C
MEFLIKNLTNPQTLLMIVVSISLFATIFTVMMPYLGGATLENRMKKVALERDNIKIRERERLSRNSDKKGKSSAVSLKETEHRKGILTIVDGLSLKKALADENTLDKLRMAGFRGNNPLIMFLFMRFVMPFIMLALAVIYIFYLDVMSEYSTSTKGVVCLLVAYLGFISPNLYVSNRITKRRHAIVRAWPDALDLLLICVESGASTEAGLRKVAEEIGLQSVELAEELGLTNAELSYLPSRRMAYENLAARTGIESIKSVMQALVQAERFGTPVATALRVLSTESREQRLNEAEKKAAALPPKLTVPMMLFFLPVIFVIILGPAYISVASNGGLFGDERPVDPNPQ